MGKSLNSTQGQVEEAPADEAWVYEKGLPRIGREPIVNHLGRRILVA